MTHAINHPGAGVSGSALDEAGFKRFQRLMYDEAGVWLAPRKKSLVAGRLTKRLKARGCDTFRTYYQLLESDADEKQLAIDLLTTNETYFFREPRHFDFLREEVLSRHRRGQRFRAWSAACSSGEEVYTLSMVLADRLRQEDWTVTGSDLNTQVLEKAQAGHYSLARTEGIPHEFLKRYCLKGTGRQAGTFLVGRALRQQVSFMQINLNRALPQLEPFDVIFLRNVMIYFNSETKTEVVRRVLGRLKPGGYFFIGHSESLTGIDTDLEVIRPSVYRKRA